MSKLKIKEGLNLFPFQVEGAAFLASRVRALIASEPGLGKTVQLITACNTVLEGGKVCVLCPKSMKLTWKREIDKWAIQGNEWYVTNYDQLLAKKAHEVLKPWDVLICDESHECIKNPKAQRAKVVLNELVPVCKRVYLSTATPANASGFDYYTTLQVLLPTLMLQWDEWGFRKQFCHEVQDRFAYGGVKYEGFKNTKILKEVFAKCAIKHRKVEVLPDLPEKMYTLVPIECGKIWDSEKNAFLLKELADGKEITFEYQQELQTVAAAKIKMILDWAEAFPVDEPLVVFAWHKSIVDLMVKGLGKLRGEVGKITGEVTDEKIRQNYIDRFQASSLKTIVLNMKSGGVGITLTAASTALYVQPPMSYITMEQSENRVHRIGSKRAVNIVRFVAVGTVEEEMYQVLDERAKNIREVGV